MKTTATNRKIRVLIRDIREEKLLPQPEFQRRLVWSNQDKRAFLNTVLEGYPFPEIYIAAGTVNPDTGDGQELLVDGQQRITTIYQYFTASPDLTLGEIPAYASLTEEEKFEFLEYDVVVRDLGKKSLADIKVIFQRINSTNYSLNAMEINNARWAGQFKKFCDGISRHTFFRQNRVFSASEIRRMLDVQFCTLLTIALMSSYQRRSEGIEEYLEAYNDDFPESTNLHREFEIVFTFISGCEFEQKSRVWKKADLFTCLVEIHRIICKEKLELDCQLVGKYLKEFYRRVDNVTSEEKDLTVLEYQRKSRTSINDRTNRIERGRIISEVIHGLWLPE